MIFARPELSLGSLNCLCVTPKSKDSTLIQPERMMSKATTLCLVLLCFTSAWARDLGSKISPPDACQSCLVAVRVLEDFLCDPNASDFLVDIVERRLCPAVGDGPKCHNIAEGLVPVIIQWFRAAATPAQLCSAAGVCGVTILKDAQYIKASVKINDNAGCSLCEYVVRYAKDILEDPATKQAVHDVAMQACATLPADFNDACVDFITQNEEMIYTFIDSFEPTETCQIVGMCMTKLAATKPAPLPAPLVHAMLPVYAVGAAQAPFSNDACDVCKMVAVEAGSLLLDPNMQKQVIDYAKSVCDQFPDFADACKGYVDAYAPLVISLLEQYLAQPDVFCQEIGLCPAAPPASLFDQLVDPLVSGSWARLVAKHGEALVGKLLGLEAANHEAA